MDADGLHELAASIKSLGVLEPVVVRPTDRGYELVAGERRWRAAQLAGLAEIPATVRPLRDAEAAIARLMENLQRQDLDPLDEARGLERLLTVHHCTVEEVAGKLGKRKAYVYGALKLTRLPDKAAEALRDGVIPRSTAELIGRVPNEKLREKAAQEIVQGEKAWRGRPLTFAEAKDLIEEEYTVELKGAPFDRESLTLVPAAGSCDACPKQAGNNRDEFPDGRADICTDPECYRKKDRAHKEQALDEARGRGIKTLPAKEAEKVFRYQDQVSAYDSKWIDLARQHPTDKKKRSYKQLVGEQLKDQVVAAADGKGKVHYLVPKESAAPILAKEFGKNDAGADRSFRRENSAYERAEKLGQRTRLLARQRVYEEVVRRLGCVIGLSSAPVAGVLEALALGAFDGFHYDGLSEELDQIAGRYGVERGEQSDVPLAEEVLKGRTAHELLGLVVERWFAETWRFDDEPPEGCGRKLLAFLRIDLKQLRKEAAAAIKAEAKAEKKAAKKPGGKKGAVGKPAMEKAEDLGLGHIELLQYSIAGLFGNGKNPKKPVAIKSLELDGRRWCVTGGVCQGDYEEWDLAPLYPIEDFEAKYPFGLKLFPDLPDDATAAQRKEFYTGVRVKSAGKEWAIGQSKEERRVSVGTPAEDDGELDEFEAQAIEDEEKCRGCGCTDGNGCNPSCWWVEDGLCSQCVLLGKAKPKTAEGKRRWKEAQKAGRAVMEGANA